MGTQEEASLSRFADLVEASPHNLLSKAGLDALRTRHIPEAVAFAETLPHGKRLIDLGSGGGLPGLVIAILRRDLEVHLVEATGKKATFLAATAAELGVVVQVHNARAEGLATGSLRHGFDLVTARALARLDRLVVLAEPFLAPKGQILAIKGARWKEELEEAGPTLRRLKLEATSIPSAQPDIATLRPLVVILERSRPAAHR
jgi:16S rRNA (guanine527-N7)-methyltransferase